MNEQIPLLTLYITTQELAALDIAAQIYLDVLEVVQPLESNKTRLDTIHHLEAFKSYYRDICAQGQEPMDAPLPLSLPFPEIMALTTAIDAYEFLDKIHCVPTSTSGLTPIEVMALTRSFQRRLVSAPTERSVSQDKM